MHLPVRHMCRGALLIYLILHDKTCVSCALQSLTKAAFDEEEAGRDAAVQEVVTALSGDAEGNVLETLRSEVDSLVEELRVEVATSAVQEHEAEQVVQVCNINYAVFHLLNKCVLTPRGTVEVIFQVQARHKGTY